MDMKRLFPFLSVLLLMAACTSEDYESGDGRWSYLRADFADVYTNGEAYMVSAMTDEGDSLLFRQRVKPSWVTTADSCYRSLVYYNYNKVEEKAEVRSVSPVLVPSVRMRKNDKDPFKDDPVKVVGGWMSSNGRYLNLDLELMTGRNDGEVVTQKLGIECDTIATDEAGRQHVALSLYHDRNDSPEYYSSEVFVSIALRRMPVALKPGDDITLSINTYDGLWQRSFPIEYSE